MDADTRLSYIEGGNVVEKEALIGDIDEDQSDEDTANVSTVDIVYRSTRLRNIIIICSTILVIVGIILAVTFSIHGIGPNKEESRQYTEFEHAAAAADAVDCSVIGRDMMLRGGSAADATVAGLLCIGIMNCHSSGIGGGDFLVYYDKGTDEVTFLDARERAPLAAYETMYDNDAYASQKGGLAIGVPGEVSGLWDLHQKYGKLEWADLFQPAINLAKNGFIVGSPLGYAINNKKDDIMPDPNLREIFVKEDGDLYKSGDIMYRPKLAVTLEKIAAGGKEAFYKGDLAKDIVQDIQDYGGIITEEDLEEYETEVRVPAHIKIDQWDLYSASAPGSGNVLALILNILDGYDLSSENIRNTYESTLTYHRMIEAFKFAYAKRSALGDPTYVDIAALLEDMVSEDYAESLRAKITDEETHQMEYYEPVFLNKEDSGTSHFSVIDADGNAAAATATVNLYFGSKCRGSRTGIIFNDEMDDFSQPGADNYFGVPPSETNFIVPGKRPMSSMTPTIILDHSTKEVLLTLGASGGTKITTAVGFVITQVHWLGRKIGHAIDMARLHDQLVPTKMNYEPNFDAGVIKGLEAKGHNVTSSTGYAVVQGIHRMEDGWLDAHSDKRKGGFPAGY